MHRVPRMNRISRETGPTLKFEVITQSCANRVINRVLPVVFAALLYFAY